MKTNEILEEQMERIEYTKGEGGYLFEDGQIVDFEELILNKIDFRRKTGALRIRITLNEVNVDFLKEKIPTRQQLEKIEELISCNKILVFEITNKNNKLVRGYGGFDKTICDVKQQLLDLHNLENLKKRLKLK